MNGRFAPALLLLTGAVGCGLFSTKAAAPEKGSEPAASAASAEPAPASGAGIACGSATCGGGEACCWNREKNEGHCAAADACTFGEESAIGCTAPSSCPGKECCQSPIGALSCEPEGTCTYNMGATLCDTLADCGVIAGTIEAKSCEARSDYPAALKFCNYP